MITRRDLIRVGAVGAGGLLLPAHLMAAPKPRQGGHIRVASQSSSTSDTLDPAKGSLSTDYVRHYMFYNGLTEANGDLTARLGLAESIETKDQTLWRFRLRKGIYFHSGKQLTAADAVYSLWRHKDAKLGSKVAPVVEPFVEIKQTGSHEFTLRLSGPNADLPVILSQSHFLIIRNGEKDFRTADGTGPYKLKQFKPGVRTIGVRNENYWRDGKPYLDSIELIGIPDDESRVNALLSGDVHYINAINPRSVKRIMGSGTHKVMETPSGLYTNLIMRQNQLPTSNPDFVMAMKYLVDRPLIKRALYRGYGDIGNDHPIQPSHRYYRADLPQRTLDLDRARWHVRRSGLANVRLPIYASPAANGSVDMASILQEYGARVGLNLAVNRVPGDGYWSTHWMRHPLSFGNTNPRPTADMVFSLFYKSDAEWNESGWKNPRFDKLLVEARGEPDEARRKQLYGEMQELVHNHCGVAIPLFISFIDGFDRRLRGMTPVPLGGFMGYNFAEHLWWEG